MASPPTPEQWTAVAKLVNSFFSKADAEPFREPVDWHVLGLFDYPQVIKAPMDLGTIKKKLSGKKYATLFQVADDVRLVWSNCMTYNADGSDFFVLAQNLKKEWEQRFSKLLQDHAVATSADAGGVAAPAGGADAAAGVADASKITLEEKRSFARSLYKISKEDLGKLLVEVDNKCQAALSRNNAEDEYELNVDKIPAAIFLELVTFVKQCGGGGGTGSGGGNTDKKAAGGSSTGGGAASGSKKKASTASGGSNKRQKS